MSSIEQANLRAIAVEACATCPAMIKPSAEGNRCAISEPYFIKWGDPDLHHAAKTQKYVYDQAVQDPSAPRVPKVYDCFKHDKYTYLVMEFIESSPLQDATHFARLTASAVDWLRRCSVPHDARIGSLGGGRARHRLFKQWEAPLLFSSNGALETYMNKAIERMPRGHWADPIHIRDEPLVFTQSDMYEGNFMLDHEGRLCLLDFDTVGLLPESFAVYTLKMGGKPFVQEVAKYLPWSSPNLASMASAGGILIMSGDSTLGLDENGEKKPRRRH